MKNQKTFVISLGGSVIIPKPDEINVLFLRQFRKLILKFLKKGYRFVIVTGGGKICRFYQGAAEKITKVVPDDQDWIGIHCTRLNAHLLRTIFRKEACPVIFEDPFKKISKKLLEKPVIIGAGWRPGWSTDYDAVLLAKRFGVDKIINASNVSFVFNHDVNKFKNAKKIPEISWAGYRKLIAKKWTPGLSSPIDPIAAKTAQKLGIKAIVVDGTNLKNLENIFKGDKFEGTVIT
jgi:uridylate kinase